jgi:hypothetical protein
VPSYSPDLHGAGIARGSPTIRKVPRRCQGGTIVARGSVPGLGSLSRACARWRLHRAARLVRATFHSATRISNVEIAKLRSTIRSRVLRLCRRRGLMGEEGDLDVSLPSESQGLLPLLCAASIQGRSALGTEPGSRIERRGIPAATLPGRAVLVKELCADLAMGSHPRSRRRRSKSPGPPNRGCAG